MKMSRTTLLAAVCLAVQLVQAAPTAQSLQDNENGVNCISDKSGDVSAGASRTGGNGSVPALIARISVLLNAATPAIYQDAATSPNSLSENIVKPVVLLLNAMSGGKNALAKDNTRRFFVPSFVRFNFRQDALSELDRIRESEHFWTQADTYVDYVCARLKNYIENERNKNPVESTTTTTTAPSTTSPTEAPQTTPSTTTVQRTVLVGTETPAPVEQSDLLIYETVAPVARGPSEELPPLGQSTSKASSSSEEAAVVPEPAVELVAQESSWEPAAEIVASDPTNAIESVETNATPASETPVQIASVPIQTEANVSLNEEFARNSALSETVAPANIVESSVHVEQSTQRPTPVLGAAPNSAAVNSETIPNESVSPAVPESGPQLTLPTLPSEVASAEVAAATVVAHPVDTIASGVVTPVESAPLLLPPVENKSAAPIEAVPSALPSTDSFGAAQATAAPAAAIESTSAPVSLVESTSVSTPGAISVEPETVVPLGPTPVVVNSAEITSVPLVQSQSLPPNTSLAATPASTSTMALTAAPVSLVPPCPAKSVVEQSQTSVAAVENTEVVAPLNQRTPAGEPPVQEPTRSLNQNSATSVKPEVSGVSVTETLFTPAANVASGVHQLINVGQSVASTAVHTPEVKTSFFASSTASTSTSTSTSTRRTVATYGSSAVGKFEHIAPISAPIVIRPVKSILPVTAPHIVEHKIGGGFSSRITVPGVAANDKTLKTGNA